MRTILCIAILLVFSAHIRAQFGYDSVPESWWIDKPIMPADCVAIIRKHYSSITIRNVDLSAEYGDTSLHDTTVWGEWRLSYSGEHISSSVWTWNPQVKEVFRTIYPITSTQHRKGKIVQKASIPLSGFRLTHYIDSTSNIDYTTSKFYKGQFFESRYFFDRIDYRYEDGLLVEAGYRNFWQYTDSNFVYAKFLFTYK